ncbi:hypothetical protein A5893_17415 [Pedobacter psychrophilus]|uniref:Uncharacterized protein n=1 Tax=Pedobacter psychrophilus TaxID=1826909 RepID=A0A179DH91_9SPHI|nr:hypothetical protein A5893_17415 [Pedobacter psychrophilus]
MKKLIKSPTGIYALTFIIFFVFCIIFVPLLSIGHSGGEQVPMTLLAYAFTYLHYSLICVSILTSIIFRTWFKKYWFINLTIFVVLIFAL